MLQIQRAIVGGEQVELQRLLDEEAGERDWGWRGTEGKTALELAAVTGQSEMVKMLIGAGAHTNVLSASGKVCHNGSYTHGDVIDTTGYSALHLATIWGQLDCVKTLVGAGADHRLATRSQETSLQLALRYGNTACADYLSTVGKS